MKLLATVFIVIGFWGLGISLIEEKRQNIIQLERQRQIIFFLQGEMGHFFKPLPDIFQKLSYKVQAPYDTFFSNVSKQLQAWNGDSLENIWIRELKQMMNEEKISPKMLCPMENLVKVLHYEDCQMQIQAIGFAREEIEETLVKKKEELEKNQKCVLWLCTMAGVLLTIIFL